MVETEMIERTMDMKNLKNKILGAVFGVFAAISLTVPSYAAVCVSGSADSLQQDPHYKEVSEIAKGLSEFWMSCGMTIPWTRTGII